MTLKRVDKQQMYAAGFTMREIEQMDAATDPSGNLQPAIDLTSPAWIAAMAHRARFTSQLRAEYQQTHAGKPLTRHMHDNIVNLWYTKGVRRSPWDWLKLTYRPKQKTDFLAAAKRRMQRGKVAISNNIRRAR